MSINWESLTFTTPESIVAKVLPQSFVKQYGLSKERIILNNLHGSIARGKLTGLMGPSGAGKSTLLHCLMNGSAYSGFNGIISQSGFTQVLNNDETETEEANDGLRACFIKQDESEHLLLDLTVKESLDYASKIRNHNHKSSAGDDKGLENNDNNIAKIIKQLGLESVQNTLAKKCSGGQKKRLAIGLELVTEPKPNIIFLDEPTSGLDSFVGELVIKLLNELAVSENIAIVVTIHQPSFKIFSLFHHVYVLSKNGEFIFAGPSAQLLQHTSNFNYPCPMNENPADFIIQIASSVSSNSNDPEADYCGRDECHDVCLRMTNYYQTLNNNSNGSTTVNFNRIPSNSTRRRRISGLCSKNHSSSCLNFGLINFYHLLHRTFTTSVCRQKRVLTIRLLLHGIVAIALVALFNRDIGQDNGCYNSTNSSDTSNNTSMTYFSNGTENATTANVRFHFFTLLFLMFTSLMATVLSFPTEIKIFLSEHHNGWYPTSCYYLAKTSIEFLIQLPYPLIYSWFLYWYTNQIGVNSICWHSGFFSLHFGHFFAITLLSCFIAQGLGFLIGILCVKSYHSTIIVASSMLLFLFLFSGFFVKRSQLPNISAWVTYLSFVRFSFESIILIIYGQGRCSSSSSSLILSSFELKDSDLLGNIYWLIGHLIVIRVLAFIALKCRAEPSTTNFTKLFSITWFILVGKYCMNFCCNLKLKLLNINCCPRLADISYYKDNELDCCCWRGSKKKELTQSKEFIACYINDSFNNKTDENHF